MSLSSLRSLVVVAEERPRVQLIATFTKLFSNFGLMSRASEKRSGQIVGERFSEQSMSGRIGKRVHVAIANPDTLGQCADSQLGEIWVSSPHNSPELLGPFDSASLTRAPGSQSQPVPGSNAAEALTAHLVTGDTERTYARTGFLGFVRRTELTQSDGELHDAIFVVGSLEEAIMLRGMRFHPVD
ncbi:unnamed protein product, partial [Echinostoma caproni]